MVPIIVKHLLVVLDVSAGLKEPTQVSNKTDVVSNVEILPLEVKSHGQEITGGKGTGGTRC